MRGYACGDWRRSLDGRRCRGREGSHRPDGIELRRLIGEAVFFNDVFIVEIGRDESELLDTVLDRVECALMEGVAEIATCG